MKSLKKFAAGVLAVMVLTTAGSVFAAEFKRPIEIASRLIGQSIESLRAQRLEGATYGEISEGYGVRDSFIEQVLEMKKAFLTEKVESGALTQEEADVIIEAMCSEEKLNDFGKELSAKFGKGLHMNENGQGKRENMGFKRDDSNTSGNNMNRTRQGGRFRNN